MVNVSVKVIWVCGRLWNFSKS